MAGENAAVLDVLAGRLRCLEYLWILGGDWNNAPEDLVEWARTVGGVVVAAPEATCLASEAGSRIDFFMVSAALAPFVRVRVCIDGLIKTHRIVELFVRAALRSVRVTRLKRLQLFPVDEPVGPRLAPGAAPLGFQADADLNDEVARWYGVAEAELTTLFCFGG